MTMMQKLPAGLGGLAFATAAIAEEAPPALDSGNTAWMIVASALVLLMVIPGLALFYGGLTRQKNVLSILAQCFAITALMSVLWVTVGYSLAFGEGNAFIGDFSKAMLSGVDVATLSGTIPESVFAMFQMTFAAITPAIIIGAFAERVKFSALLLFSALWSLVVYAPMVHMVWAPNGLLFGEGVLDFAGGTVVHIASGVAGLVAALVIGKRKGYGKTAMTPHNLALTMIGGALLWVGWFGFNAGSALAADGRAGMAMLVTQVAAASGALAWMALEWIKSGKPSLLGLVSGAVAGLVGITPAAGFVGPAGAIAIGLLTAAGCYYAVAVLKHKLGYDDSLDAFGIHGIGGTIGAILTGVFAVEGIGGTAGALEGNVALLWIQTEAILVTLAHVLVATFLLLKLVDKLVGLRVSEEEEQMGLDIASHGERLDAYAGGMRIAEFADEAPAAAPLIKQKPASSKPV